MEAEGHQACPGGVGLCPRPRERGRPTIGSPLHGMRIEKGGLSDVFDLALVKEAVSGPPDRTGEDRSLTGQ